MKKRAREKLKVQRKKHRFNFARFKTWIAFSAAVTGLYAGFKRLGRTRARQGKRKNDFFTQYAWVVPVVLIFGIVALWNRGAVQYPLATMSAKLTTMFMKAQPMSRGDRIAYWSQALYKNPALLSALAPGPKISDTAPIFPNGYDCTTYVETVGALSRSDAGTDLVDQLVSLRYKDGRIDYLARNHFPEADWIPNNASAGNLEDITVLAAKKAGVAARFALKDIDKLAWFSKQKNVNASRAIASMKQDAPAQVRLPYIPLNEVKEAVGQLPQGTIVNVVRENQKRKPVLITHQAFLIWKNGVPYLRHASSFKEITEIPLTKYLSGLKAGSWPVLGLNFNQYL